MMAIKQINAMELSGSINKLHNFIQKNKLIRLYKRKNRVLNNYQTFSFVASFVHIMHMKDALYSYFC